MAVIIKKMIKEQLLKEREARRAILNPTFDTLSILSG
jgi:hypothetical protein